MKKPRKFTPSPAGTIRGPFECGMGNSHNAGIQFAVKYVDGCWRYFIEEKRNFDKAKEAAEAFSKAAKEKNNGKT